jgi:NitT/TauT family transport system ATP-binding protein
MSDAEPLLELRQVSKHFAATDRADAIVVLKEIDFSLHPGEIVALLGRSGCGKSTLLRIICGLTPASGGHVRYRGQPVTRPTAGLSMVFQTFGLFPWLTVLENVELGLEAQGVPTAERRRRALAAIDLIGLDGFESAYPRELSGGMRQRVGFARALVVDPDVLLMDEAFSALDVPPSETLRGVLLDLWLERQIPTRAILMVSHSIEEALMIADRVVILDSNPGRVKAELPITLKHPRDYTAPVFRRLVEHVYERMTAVAGEPRASGRKAPKKRRMGRSPSSALFGASAR